MSYIIPPRNLLETVAANGAFSTLGKAIAAAGLSESLRAIGPFTVFAPTNAAFARLPEGTLENWLKPENKAQLIAILRYHFMNGRVSAADVGKLRDAPTLQGQHATLKTSDGNVTINDANVTLQELKSSNGVIFPIDQVIMPTRH